MLRGCPASGKTYWAKDRAQRLGWFRVSMDDIRESVYGGYGVKKERMCLKLRDEMIREGIRQNKTVVVDATNLNPRHERRIRAVAEEMGAKFEINDSFLEKTPQECIAADLHRGKDAVGSKVIWEMFNRWIRPKAPATLKEKSDKRRCFLIDLDGTLCKNISGRSYYDMEKVDLDQPLPLISFLIDCINESGQYYCDIVLLTGRTEDGRTKTEQWLKDNGLDFKALFMREVGDKRPDYEFKQEVIFQRILPNWEILGAIDNSMRCCEMYYNLGIDVLKAGVPGGDF